MDDIVVDVNNLVKRYRGAQRNAVDGVTFDVRAGEFFALLGPNGAGKSTTLSILTTTLAPTSGSVRIVGLDARRSPAAVRKQIGIIFQNPSLDMNLTGEENIRLHAVLYRLYPYRPTYKMMPAKYRSHVSEIAAVLDMESDMFRPVRRLSGGMRRKLEIIRVLMHQPRVLFLDEPTAGLDVASRNSLWTYLSEIRRRQETTIFLTTHYLEEAESADRLVFINSGQVVSKGTPRQIRASVGGESLEVDAVDRDALRGALQRLGVSFAEGDGFNVTLNGRPAYDVVRAIDVPLTVMRTHQASLDDVYLRLLTHE